MVDQIGVAYGVVLILGGLISFFRRKSALALLFGLVFGAWTTYNAMHPTRQNNVANLAIGAVLGILVLLRTLFSGRWFPSVIVIALSVAQVFRNYPYLK